MGCHEQTELSISIVGDRTIQQLNRQYLGKDRPTNVISFSLQEGEFGHINRYTLGDVIVSADTAAREAEEGGVAPYARLVFLLLHGILHLCGYDHERSGAEEAARMEAKEQEIWQVLLDEQLTVL